MYCLRLAVILFFLKATRGNNAAPLHGRYTRDVEKYDLLVPKKLTEEGHFLTFSLPHYYAHDSGSSRAKRSIDQKYTTHYGITLDGIDYHLELEPNHGLIAPDSVVERRSPNVRDIKMKRLADGKLCNFRGIVRGIGDSQVALSTCDGLAGYILVGGRRYFVEPLLEHVPNKRGQHLHMVYETDDKLEKRYKGPHCGTVEDWKEAWKNRFRKSLAEEDSDQDNNKRGLQSVHRYLETLVVADKKFLEHHKNTDYELYILTIMNMVSDFYHDASAGNQMDLVVVRVMYLEKEEEEIDLAISRDADKTLSSFCNWQQSVNPKDIKNPNHHDIAILLTRYDICSDNMASCGLMGLAYVAAACTGDKPCAINEDGGLILGIVVAHEIGHVMGCSHDTEEDSGCKAQAEDQSYHVMSPFVHLHTNIWSTCSKTFMTTFFDNDLGECLNDEPETSLFENNNMLPGTIYDAKYQCQIQYPGSSVCKPQSQKFCEMLLCRTSPTECLSDGDPPADGTKCGENKWCYNKKCVEIGERPEAVNGGWGEWGSYSECSRTCGGGTSMSERDCINPRPQHKGRYCLGERKRYKICNIQPCAENSPPFRAVQCSEFDSNPFEDKLYKWKPYTKEDAPCSLYCINDQNVYAKLAPRAKDGTRCKPGTKNMCVGGVCRVVGCDNVLDSDAVEDDCGVCKGDGTECKIVDRTFQAPPGHGYVKVAVIFRGCRKVEVEELKPSGNIMAITGPDEKHYYLNGDFTEQSDGARDFGGTEGIYSHPEPDKELLYIHGPLKENIVLFVVFFENENVGYRYKYSEPTPKSNYQPTYQWEFVDWEPCSTKCGGGVELSVPKCIEEKAGLVSSSFCQATEKPPPKTRKCNEQPCHTKWRVGKWGKCMACKNISGLRLREVECVREASRAGEEDVLVEDVECKEKRPGTRELCNAKATCVGRKRENHGLPDDMMRRVWLQTIGNAETTDEKVFDTLSPTRNMHKVIRDVRLHKKKRDECDAESDKKTSKVKLKIGTIIEDPIDKEGIQLIEIPVRQSHNALNLSDAAYESMGDTVPDTLDFKNEKVHKGKEAVDMLNAIQHGNGSYVETN